MPTPRKLKLRPIEIRDQYCHPVTGELTMNTPRKATRERFPSFNVGEQRLENVSASFYLEMTKRWDMFDELVEALGVALQTIELGPDTVAKGNTIPFIKDLIARASSEAK